MYHQFKNRITIDATLKAETALYIGAGQESFAPMAVQGSLLKNQLGLPYIPGSSLKGVLRSFLESVQGKIEGVKTAACVSCNGDYAKKEKRQAKIDELGGEAAFAAYIQEKSCPACRLFGSGIMAGKLKFADATLKQPEAWMGTELRTGNAIDRDTHTASGGALFDTEAIPSGTEFSLCIIAENLTVNEAKIFSELLQYFAQGGITVGGRSRAGLGMVSVAEKEMNVQMSYIEKEKNENSKGEKKLIRFAPITETISNIALLSDELVEKGAAYV